MKKKDEASKTGGAAGEGASLSQSLASLTKGLLYMSESDYPLVPFVVEKGAAADARAAAIPKDSQAEVSELGFDNFFGNATREQDWQDEAARATVTKFQALVKFLKENLRDIKVYRVGGVEADVYVVGRTESGGFAGVKTKVVET
jgi:Nuclease A inhibitor-like protein